MEKELINRNNLHKGWIDYLRIFACFLVVLTHVSSVYEYGDNVGISIMIATRPCVPLFVMITGVLLFPLKDSNLSLAKFYKKRLGRYALPLFFWSIVILFIIYIINEYFSGVPFKEMFTWHQLKTKGIIRYATLWIISINDFTGCYWYLYMLLGLYFVIPMLNSWMKSASKRDLQCFLMVWIFTLFIPYIRIYAAYKQFDFVFGEYHWNAYGMFYYVSGFIGYLVAGHYFMKYPINLNSIKNRVLLTISYLIGLIAGFAIYYSVINIKENYIEYLDALFQFCGINTFMMTFPIFVIFRNLKINSGKGIRMLANMTFGIYLTHIAFEKVICGIFPPYNYPKVLYIIICSILTFIFSSLFCRILWQWKVTRKLIS